MSNDTHLDNDHLEGNNVSEKTLGEPVDHWTGAGYPLSANPSENTINGQYCRLSPLSTDDTESLWQAYANINPELWDYLPYGPFTPSSFVDFIHKKSQTDDAVFYTIRSQLSNQALGFIAYSRIQPKAGSIEVAHVCFSPALQKTTAATEAVYLMINRAFDLGYRRCEWKCNSLNEGSKKAAQRFGFTYEGQFRQAAVLKGHNRDTNWYSILDKEWPQLKTAYIQWLSPDNFDQQDQQLRSLKDISQQSHSY